jgi:hypothetical protein
MGLPEGQKITKKFLRERMTMAQYDKAWDHYGETLRQILEEDVPNFPSASASDAEPSAPEPTPAEDPDAEAKAKLRAEATKWGIQASEIEHVIAHHPLEKARTILWQARRQQSQPTPIESAAD